MERASGADAVFLHLETRDIPLHTLKVVVLEPGAAGPLTVARLRELVRPYLGVSPRATQRVHVAPGAGGRPLWLDVDVDLAAHVDETSVADGSRAGLDEVCARLAEQHLDRSRPLWAMTLVNGLDDGRQAVVVRVHHAIADGVAALNTLLAVTTDTRGEVAPPSPASAPLVTGRRDRVRAIARGNYAQLTEVPHLVRSGLASRRVTPRFRGARARARRRQGRAHQLQRPRRSRPRVRQLVARPRDVQGDRSRERRDAERRAARGDRRRDARGVRRARRPARRARGRDVRRRRRPGVAADARQRHRPDQRVAAGRPGRPGRAARRDRAELPAVGRPAPPARVRALAPGVRRRAAAGAR